MSCATDLKKRLKTKRVQMGALAYRNKLDKLPETAARIVFRLEAGDTLWDVIDAIAWERYHFGVGTTLLQSEIRAAQLEVYHHIHRIRAAFTM